jgi:SAM-dependent methyltransferase
MLWPYALPLAPSVYERRWRRRIEQAPVMSASEHAERVGLDDIEEVIGCSLCGEDRVQPLLHPGEGGWGYEVVRCPACGFLYRHPGIQPDRLGELYAGKYSKFLTGHYSEKRRRRYELGMEAFAPTFAAGTGRRLLDFGCGAGQFLDLAQARGFEVYGVDLSQDAIDTARERHPHAHFGAPLDVPEIAAGGFDVITMWSVLAHLATPVEDLTMLRSLLAPGGRLLILTVNANSLYLKAVGERWNGFTRNHLKFYGPETLGVLLRRAGFSDVVFKPMYGDGVEEGTTAMAPSFERRLRATIDEGNRGNMLRALASADSG